MGQTTLAETRYRLGFVLGNVNAETSLFDTWINAGYFEVVGAVQFDKFREVIEIDFAAGTNYVEVDSILDGRVLSFSRLLDYSGEVELEYTNPDVFQQFKAAEGDSTLWTISGGRLRIWETPASAFTVTATAIVEPPRLSLPTDVTEIPSTWDEAIFLLSAEKALLDLGEETRAVGYANRAIAYMQSRLGDGDFNMRREGGFRVISSESELRSVRGS